MYQINQNSKEVTIKIQYSRDQGSVLECRMWIIMFEKGGFFSKLYLLFINDTIGIKKTTDIGIMTA